jgi:4-amino-4-deoxy-L-arabinose transferase-like glycosyltransferase
VWHLTNKFMGAAWAAVSVFLFTTIPAVLAHSALATTDMAGTAMFLLALVAWLRWRAEPGWKQSIALGIAVGLALLTKISVLPFLAVTLAALVISDWTLSKRLGLQGRTVAVVCVVGLVTIWAGYRFSFGPILRPGLQLHQLNRIVGDTGQLHDTTYRYLSERIKLPAHEFLMGMVDVASMNSHGTRTYFLGRVSERGRWQYFPLLLATKLPIVILLLAAAGIAAAIGGGKELPQEFIRLVLIGIAAPLLVASFSTINLGLRHVLTIMPFVAMLAGIGLWKIWNTIDRPGLRWVATGILLATNAASCWSAAPDFLSYFNQPSRKYSADIVVDSDLDWGQDLNRLCAALERYPAGARVFIAYKGTADLSRFALPPWQRLPRRMESKGVVAISLFLLKTYPEDFGWLEKYQPAQRVGYSMLIYDLR